MKKAGNEILAWDIKPTVSGYEDQSNVTTLALPGVLAHGKPDRPGGWIRPIAPALLERGELRVIDYGNEGTFDAERIIKATAEEIDKLHEAGRRVAVLGSSLGGNIASFAIHEAQNVTPENTATIEVDAPFGLDTFKPLTGLSPKMQKNFGRLAGKLSKLSSVDGLLTPTATFAFTRPSGLPKDEEISSINDEWMRSYVTDLPASEVKTEEQFKEAIKALAKEGLTGNSMTVYLGQIAWMSGISEGGTLASNYAKIKSPVYAACSDDKLNATVVQPLAGNRHHDANPDTVIVDVKGTPHAAYLQQQHLWESTIGRIYDQLEAPRVNPHLRDL